MISKIKKYFGICEHECHVHPTKETKWYYGSIGQVLAFDTYSICKKCNKENKERVYT